MKKALPLIVGFFPLLLGYLFNRLMMAFPETLFPYGLISCICFGLWGMAGYYLTAKVGGTHTGLFAHIPSAAAIVLIVIQVAVFDRYWDVIGIITQWFFTPFIRLPVILLQFVGVVHISVLLCNGLAFFMLMGAFYLGSRYGKKKQS